MSKKRFLPDGNQDYKDYFHKLTPDEKQLIENFYNDFYAGGVYSERTILKTEEAKEEAKRNHGALKRDVMEVAQRRGELSDIDENTVAFMNDACDEDDWRNAYDLFGFKAAALVIYEQATKDLKSSKVSVKVTLNRFFEKMLSLKRLNWRERKHKRKNK